jgi:hypothetical protein
VVETTKEESQDQKSTEEESIILGGRDVGRCIVAEVTELAHDGRMLVVLKCKKRRRENVGISIFKRMVIFSRL